jgi:hypothetical protein
MPGFNIGGGGSGKEPSITSDIKRVHRWRIDQLGELIINRDVHQYAQSLTWPNISIDEETVMGAAINYKFAKAASFDDVTIAFYDADYVFSNLETWFKLIYTPNSGIGMANEYKKDSKFTLTDGMGEQLDTVTLKNSWPKSISHSQLTYDNSELKLVNLTLSYDWAEFE